MPVFGGYAPFPIRFGESPSTVETMTKALNSSRGSAFDTTEGQSPVWVENTAIARAIADVWATNERLGLQTDLSRTTMLSRWESMMGVVPSPTQSDADRRAILLARQQQATRSATYQGIVDYLQARLAPLTFRLFWHSSFWSTTIVSHPPSWYVAKDSSSLSMSGNCTMSGFVKEMTTVEVTITSGGGLGSATYVMEWVTSAGRFLQKGTTAASIPIGSTGLTFSFPNSATNDGMRFLSIAYAAGFSSSVCKLTVYATKPSGMTDAEYFALVSQVPSLLDPILPAQTLIETVRDGVGVFTLDSPGNLDNQPF